MLVWPILLALINVLVTWETGIVHPDATSTYLTLSILSRVLGSHITRTSAMWALACKHARWSGV